MTISNTAFSNAVFSSSDTGFSGPVFSGPVFSGPVFSGPVFSGAAFSGAAFSNCHLGLVSHWLFLSMFQCFKRLFRACLIKQRLNLSKAFRRMF
ncbi:pentapeptide repeat-containing protein [Vreelandella aquamarina]